MEFLERMIYSSSDSSLNMYERDINKDLIILNSQAEPLKKSSKQIQ